MTSTRALACLCLLTACPPTNGLDSAEQIPDDPYERALWRVAQVDEQLAEDLGALARLTDGVGDDELTALEAVATAVEVLGMEDPRAIALLRSLPAQGFEGEQYDRPTVTKPEGQVADNVDIHTVAGWLTDGTLHLELEVYGELSEDVALGFYLDHGPGTLGIDEILLWRQGTALGTYAYQWRGPLISDGWQSTTAPADTELTLDGSVAALAVPLGELAPDLGDGQLRVQAIAYDVSAGVYDLAPYLSLRREPTHGPIEELLELAMLAEVTADPALAVASALVEAPVRLVIAEDLLPQAREDAVAWYEHGLTLDRLAGTSIWHKAAWSWRGLETSMYGALPLYALPWRLDAEGYAHDFLTIDELLWWTALAESEGLLGSDDLGTTVAAVEDWMDDKQDYRTYTEAMEAFCAKGWLDAELCEDWRKEVEAGEDDLGEVMGQPISYYESSPIVQRQMWEERGRFYGDCGSHTAVVSTILQGQGVPMANGQYVSDEGWVIHNFPIYLDAGAGLWRAYQLPCWEQYADDGAGFYQYVTPRQMEDYLSAEFSSVPDYGGGSIHYGHTTFGALCDRLTAGIPDAELEQGLFERWWADQL